MDSLGDILVQTGLESVQAEIYLILNQGGEMTVPQILTKTELSRATVYEALTFLLASGYADYRKAGRVAYYQAAHPTKLFSLLEEKKRQVALLEEEVKQTITTLTGAYNLANHKSGVRFFEGAEGIKEATFDSLRATGAIYTFADIEAIDKYAREMNRAYGVERVRRKIPKKLIALDTPYTRRRYETAPPASKLMEVRLLPSTLSPFKIGLQIYDDTISYSTLTAEKQVGVIIVDANIAGMHRTLFEYVWSALPPLPSITPPAA